MTNILRLFVQYCWANAIRCAYLSCVEGSCWATNNLLSEIKLTRANGTLLARPFLVGASCGCVYEVLVPSCCFVSKSNIVNTYYFCKVSLKKLYCFSKCLIISALLVVCVLRFVELTGLLVRGMVFMQRSKAKAVRFSMPSNHPSRQITPPHQRHQYKKAIETPGSKL